MFQDTDGHLSESSNEKNLNSNSSVRVSTTELIPNNYIDTFFIMHFFDSLPPLGIEKNQKVLPHVTFLGPAVSNSEAKSFSFVENIKDETSSIEPFVLKAVEVKFFGVDKNIPVVECENTLESQALHESLLRAQVKSSLTLTQPYFAGKFFTPHSSLVEGFPMFEGAANIDSFTVVRHIGGYGSGVVDILAHFSLTS
jgi:hypothetical protein